MADRRKFLLIVPMIAAMAGIGVRTVPAVAQAPVTVPDPDAKRKEKNLEAGEVEAKQLLLLMDQDKSGKVSKKEFMSFMEAEFQRLDINKDGELDVRELVQSQFVPRGGRHR
jgi:hypothetical protein